MSADIIYLAGIDNDERLTLLFYTPPRSGTVSPLPYLWRVGKSSSQFNGALVIKQLSEYSLGPNSNFTDPGLELHI